MTKHAYSEKAYRDWLDTTYPRGITLDNGDFFRSAKEFQTKSNTTFRAFYNDWLDGLEKDGIETGVYLK